MKNWEDYVDSNGVLKNKLGITNVKELVEKETEIVTAKLSLLILNGIEGNFDLKHLCDIHKYLFEELYDFAGELREVDIYKKYTAFLSHEKLKETLDKVMKEAIDQEVNQNNSFEIAKFLGDYYYNLILIHPFREGNGRCIREFLREFTNYKFPNYHLDYTKINKENFLLGITEKDTYPLLLAYEINNALVKNQVKSK